MFTLHSTALREVLYMNHLIFISIIGLLLFSGCVTSESTTNSTTPIQNTTPGENTIPGENTPTVPPSVNPPVENVPVNTPTTFTLADISSHNTASDCWTAINGKVYDLTDFVNGHPGGPGILGACGIDGTTLFTTRNGNGPHPASAAKTIEEYYIGELA